jgi:hypothetical protein
MAAPSRVPTKLEPGPPPVATEAAFEEGTMSPLEPIDWSLLATLPPPSPPRSPRLARAAAVPLSAAEPIDADLAASRSARICPLCAYDDERRRHAGPLAPAPPSPRSDPPRAPRCPPAALERETCRRSPLFSLRALPTAATPTSDIALYFATQMAHGARASELLADRSFAHGRELDVWVQGAWSRWQPDDKRLFFAQRPGTEFLHFALDVVAASRRGARELCPTTAHLVMLRLCLVYFALGGAPCLSDLLLLALPTPLFPSLRRACELRRRCADRRRPADAAGDLRPADSASAPCE